MGWESDLDQEFSLDSIYDGRLKVLQPRRGYRFSLDALLLADFSKAAPGQTGVDLGTGSGVVALALAWRMGRGRVVGVEIQPRPAECARRNLGELNALEVETTVLEMDWRDLKPSSLPGPVDWVTANPPYRLLGSGRVNPETESALARHEYKGDARSAIRAAGRILKKGGVLTLVYPASRLAGLMTALRAEKLEPKRLRPVYSREGESARLVLVEARLGGGEEASLESPLLVYGPDGDYTPELKSILSGRPPDGPTARPEPLSSPGL